MSAWTKGTSARKGKGACLRRCLAEAFLVLLVGFAQASGEAAGEKVHPRIFFHTKDLASGRDLRGRVAITGSHAEEYALLCQWAEAQLPRKVSEVAADSDLCQESALTYALLYQLSGDSRYGDRTVALIRALTSGKDGRLPGFDWQKIPATVATVFDWTYDRLSPEDRTRLLYDILKRGIYIRDRKAPAEPQALQASAPDSQARGLSPLSDATPYLKPLALASLALAGEPEAARYAPDWQEFCGRVLAEQLATLDSFGGDGAWLPRAGGLSRELDILEVLEAWRTGTGGLSPPGASAPARLDEAGRATSHFRNLSRRILYRLRPGLILPGLAGLDQGAAGRQGVLTAGRHAVSGEPEKAKAAPPREPAPTSLAPGGPQATARGETGQVSVPPSLLYLLADYEDQPTGRWLAETIRLADALEPGSPAWLRDLRARILWLTKGTPRLSPKEAGLPLAASFADTGEVILRSDWDFSRPESTWLLFRASLRDPAPFAYWNHLTLVRGSDALAVETNIVASGNTGYEEGWFGTALAQNSVFDASGKPRGPKAHEGSETSPPAEVACVLEACTVDPGFVYVRGRVGRPALTLPSPTGRGVGGEGGASGGADPPTGRSLSAGEGPAGLGLFEFTREVVAFYDGVAVVRDRLIGFSRPVWVLHMLDEPKVSGRVRTLAGTAEGGIRESAEPGGIVWQTGQSRGHLSVLLPRERRLSTIGGTSYQFWSSPGRTAGQNLWPTVAQADGTPLPYSPEALRRAEVGTWRVEIEPGEKPESSGPQAPETRGVRSGTSGQVALPESQTEREGQPEGRQPGPRGTVTQFLTVLAAGGRDSGEPQASLEAGAQAAGAGGVQVRVTWQGRLYRVALEDDGTGTVEVSEAGSGKVLIEGRYPGGKGESQ